MLSKAVPLQMAEMLFAYTQENVPCERRPAAYYLIFALMHELDLDLSSGLQQMARLLRCPPGSARHKTKKARRRHVA